MASYDEITAEEANRRRGEFYALDVRAEHEFRGPLGHVRGATLIPLAELAERANELPTDRPLLLICRSGNRSGTACERLGELGIGPVVNLTGGMMAWNRAQLPLEHTAPASFHELLEQIVAYLGMVGPRSPDAERKGLKEQMEGRGASFDQPTHTAVADVLDGVEKSLRQPGGAQTDGPPDLELSLSSFRRSLAAL